MSKIQKIINSLPYRIVIFSLEGILLINLGIMFYKSRFGDGNTSFWTAFWINLFVLLFIFTFDVIFNACNDKYIFIQGEHNKEEKYEIKKYGMISFYVSVAIAVLFWVSRSIQYIDINEYGFWSFLLILFLICVTVFCIFFYMFIVFVIGMKIIETNREFEKEKNKKNKNNLSHL